MKLEQAYGILAVLNAAVDDVYIERTPLGGFAVAVSLAGGEEYSSQGVDLVDALGQVTTALALELDLDMAHPEPASDDTCDADKPIEYSLEAPVEFCTRFVTLADDDSALREAV